MSIEKEGRVDYVKLVSKTTVTVTVIIIILVVVIVVVVVVVVVDSFYCLP